MLIHQVVQNCSETCQQYNIMYLPGLQLKNKYTRNRRIRTYTIATTHNLLCYYKLYLYRIPIQKLKCPFMETINYIRPSLIIRTLRPARQFAS